MNGLNPHQQPGKFAVSSENLLAILGMVALFQIIVCFCASSGLVEPADQIRSAIQTPAWETNAPLVREGGTVTIRKLSCFQSVTTHG